MTRNIWLVCWFALLIASCSNKQTAGGSTVETENAVAFQVLTEAGKPAANALVKVRPSWFVLDTNTQDSLGEGSLDATTDSKGWVRCQGLPVGDYVVEVRGNGVGALSSFFHGDTSKQESLVDLTLKPYGHIRGMVVLPDSAKHAWLQIFGVHRMVQTDSAGRFTLDSLPPGVLHLRAIEHGQESQLAEDFVLVRSEYVWDIGTLPEATLYSEDPLAWRHSLNIPVDSLVSDWMLPLTDPSVLTLRLDSNNFDFSQAMKDGRDLRMFDATGNRLIIQRAFWNQTERFAVVRVKLSNVPLTSELELRWGCQGALDPGSEGLWEGIADSLQQEENSVLVGNFESGTMATNLPSPISPHNWYLIPQDTTVTMTPIRDSAVQGIQAAGLGRSGNAYHIITNAPSFKWALLGTVLNTVPKNFSALDSVVFWVRGSGKYSFSLESLVDSGGKALYNDTLDTAWTKKCIRPSDFLAGDSTGGNVGWNVIRQRITNLSLFVVGVSDFWVDDIRIYGVNRDDLK